MSGMRGMEAVEVSEGRSRGGETAEVSDVFERKKERKKEREREISVHTPSASNLKNWKKTLCVRFLIANPTGPWVGLLTFQFNAVAFGSIPSATILSRWPGRAGRALRRVRRAMIAPRVRWVLVGRVGGRGLRGEFFLNVLERRVRSGSCVGLGFL